MKTATEIENGRDGAGWGAAAAKAQDLYAQRVVYCVIPPPPAPRARARNGCFVVCLFPNIDAGGLAR